MSHHDRRVHSMTKERKEALTGVVLAGGRSTRLRRNKALVELGGVPLVERQVRRLGTICREVILVANDPEPYGALGVRIVPDQYRDKGPLAGIHAGLAASTTDYSFVVACDMPFFSPQFAAYMLGQARGHGVVIPCLDGFDEPLHAIYSRECLGVIESVLQREALPRVVDFFPTVKVLRIRNGEMDQLGFPRHVFFNINTPGELERALALEAGA
jgi:molybdopterin-guanine dinucleotide biosynthesis protein A